MELPSNRVVSSSRDFGDARRRQFCNVPVLETVKIQDRVNLLLLSSGSVRKFWAFPSLVIRLAVMMWSCSPCPMSASPVICNPCLVTHRKRFSSAPAMLNRFLELGRLCAVQQGASVGPAYVWKVRFGRGDPPDHAGGTRSFPVGHRL